MRLAYLDTSYLVAIAFEEPGALALAARMREFDRLFSSNLLEAEFRSTLLREGMDQGGGSLLSWVTWVLPNRTLTAEFDRIAGQGYLKGADLWHLACALFLDPGARELTFLTLDKRQKEVAAKLGFSQ